MPTIDDVIKKCQDTYSLNVTSDNSIKYAAFVGRQARKHNPEDQRNFVLLVDKLMLFSYLIRQSPVAITGFGGFGERIIIDTDEKLPALRVRGNGSYLWDDKTLYSIYARREQNHRAHNLPRYTAIIDELGIDPGVLAVWRRRLSYDKDVSSQKASPRTRAFRQGRSPFSPKMGRLGR